MLQFFTNTQWYIVAICTIATTTILIERSIRLKILSIFWGRKILHIVAISICAFIAAITANYTVVATIFLLSSLVLFFIIKFNILYVQHSTSYGIVLFPLAFAIISYATFLEDYQKILSFLILAYSDSIAGIIGYYSKQKTIIFLEEPKTLIGSIVFFICTSLLFIAWHLYVNKSIEINSIIVFALLPTFAELFSSKGSDNLTVPIVSAIWLYIINTININGADIAFLFLLSLLAIITVLKKWLTKSGATAAFAIGMVLYFTIGFKAFALPSFLLIAGSFLSKLQATKEKEIRDSVQVFCNGLVGAICLLAVAITNNPIFLIAYCISFCISISDSCSSEGGKLFNGKTLDILTRKPSAKGLSGGVSLAGTIIGFASALIAALFSYFLFNFSKKQLVLIAFLGFTGMVVDSIIGSAFQAKYKQNNGLVVEEKNQNTAIIKGHHCITNNMVNIISNAIVTIAFICLAFIF